MAALALDTCLDVCGVALVNVQGDIYAQQKRTMIKGHAEYLAPMVQECLRTANIAPAEISRVAVTTGPGSFTGQRVGLAFARGFVIGTDIPVIGVTTLELLAAQLRESSHLRGTSKETTCIHVVIDARRGQVYGQSFGCTGLPLCAPFVATPQEAVEYFKNSTDARAGIWIGSGVALLPIPDMDNVTPEIIQPDPVVLGQLAWQRTVSVRPPEAFYLRAADATPTRPVFL